MGEQKEHVAVTLYLTPEMLAKLDARVKAAADESGLNASRTAIARILLAKALDGDDASARRRTK